jgi:hypothetical protein
MFVWQVGRSSKLIDDEMTVTAYCHAPLCNHHARLDLPALRGKLGPDAPAMHNDLVPKLCKRRSGAEFIAVLAVNACRDRRVAFPSNLKALSQQLMETISPSPLRTPMTMIATKADFTLVIGRKIRRRRNSPTRRTLGPEPLYFLVLDTFLPIALCFGVERLNQRRPPFVFLKNSIRASTFRDCVKRHDFVARDTDVVEHAIGRVGQSVSGHQQCFPLGSTT